MLTDEEMRKWREEGYLLLRGLIPQESIAATREGLARVVDTMISQLKDQDLIQDEGKSLPFETRFSTVAGEHAKRFGRSWRKSVACRELFDLHYSPGLVDVIGQLTGTDVIGHPVFNGRPKLPHQQLTVVPWHQDSAYFGAESAQALIIAAWVPLVPVDAENGCMQVVSGSHRNGLIEHCVEDREGQFLEISEQLVHESQVVTCDMAPGDMLLMHNLTYHRSLANASDTIRWSVDLRYLRDGDPLCGTWNDPDFTWVIRSNERPITTYEEWIQRVDSWEW